MRSLDRWERVAWSIVGVLVVVTAGWSLWDPSLYDGLVPDSVRPGALSQDLVSVIVGPTLIGLALTGGGRLIGRLVGLGLLGYVGYAYGILVIERAYNPLYLIYLAIFAGAVWSLVLGCVAVVRSQAGRVGLGTGMRRLGAAGAMIQPLIFYPLWIGMLIPLVRDRDQIDSLYSIFILDLCFIMPAFALVSVGLWRNRSWAALLAPMMFVLGATLILSLAVGELVRPMFDQPITATGLLPTVALTALFAVLAVALLHRLESVELADHRRPVAAR